MHRSLILFAHALAIITPALGEDRVYTEGIIGGSHPMITPGPNVPDTTVTGHLTISLTNSFGNAGGSTHPLS